MRLMQISALILVLGAAIGFAAETKQMPHSSGPSPIPTCPYRHCPVTN